MKKIKLFLLVFVLSVLGIGCFSSAGNLVFTGHVDYSNINKRGLVLLPHYSADNYSSTLTCNLTNLVSSSNWSLCYSVSYAGSTLIWSSKNDNCWSVLSSDTTYTTTWTIYSDIAGVILRNNTDGVSVSFDYECTYDGQGINLKCPVCEECQECVSSRSELYINDIFHEGKPLININIPDYIQWDYQTDEDDFNLYVGSGYDLDYINAIVDINSYRPTSEDFTDIFVSGLTLIMPYIFILLFIVFVWRLIKRIFK